MTARSTHDPMVSVIVPVFNMGKFLEECLDSIANQSYQNLEVILVDDGSTDSSNMICKEYLKKDNRFNLYTQKNSGVSAARNLGLSMARGTWIMFIDPDDKVEYDIIERLFELSDDQTDIICCCCQVIDGDKMTEDHFLESDSLFTILDEKEILYCQLLDQKYRHPGHVYTTIGVPWGKLYRRSMLEDNKLLFNESLLRMQDILFNAYAFYYANQIKYVDKALYIYRFDHASRFLADYADRLLGIYNNLQHAWEKAFTDLHLFDSKFLKRMYYEKAIFNLVVVCKYGIFIKRRTLSEQKSLFIQLINIPGFKKVLMDYKKIISMRKYMHQHPFRAGYFYFIAHKHIFLLHMWGKYSYIFGR